MAVSRKRAKELKRLRGAATELWENQKDLLEHASIVAREASRQAGHLSREEVAPRVRDAYESNVRPRLDTAGAATQSAIALARGRYHREIAPAVNSAVASALAALEVSKDPRVREAFSRVSKVGHQFNSKIPVVPAKKTPGPGRYILIGLAVVAAVGVAYAAWQTLRADDELWVSDETDETPAATPAESTDSK